VPQPAEVDDAALDGPAITVTDGRQIWRIDLLPARTGARAIAHFPAHPPPRGAELWIATVDGVEALASPAATEAASGTAFCGLAGDTRVDTPQGPVAVADLRAGMAVCRSDGGSAPVLWTGARAVSGARLVAMPDLAPVRIAAGALAAGLPRVPLLVAPDQGVMLAGAAVQALYPKGAVTVAARDLVDGRGIARASGLPGFAAHVVILDGAGTLIAGGVALDATLPPGGLPGCPATVAARMDSAATAHRRLTRGEAAILQAAMRQTVRQAVRR
jgi:hypothetical protein